MNLITEDIDETMFEYPPGRVKEYEVLVNDAHKAMRFGKVTNRFIYGPTGTGKTYVAKTFVYRINKKFEEDGYGDRYHAVYVGGTYAKNQTLNKDATAHFYEWLNNMYREGFFSKADVRELGYKVGPSNEILKPTRGGKSAIEVFDNIISLLKARTSLERIFVFFDDVQIIQDWDSLLRPTLRFYERENARFKFNFYFITTSRMIIEKRIAADLRAHFGWNITAPGHAILFTPYNAQKIKEIFEARLDVALPHDEIPKSSVLDYIARVTENVWEGNIRLGLRALQEVVISAYLDGKNPKGLEIGDVSSVVRRVLLDEMVDEIFMLDIHQKIMLLTLLLPSASKGVTIDTLFKNYLHLIDKVVKDIHVKPLKKTSFYTRLNGLVDMGILSTAVSKTPTPRGGRPPTVYGWNPAEGWREAFLEYVEKKMEEDIGISIKDTSYLERLRDNDIGTLDVFMEEQE